MMKHWPTVGPRGRWLKQRVLRLSRGLFGVSRACLLRFSGMADLNELFPGVLLS